MQAAAARLTQAVLGIPGAAAGAALSMRWRQMPPAARWGWGGVALLLLVSAATVSRLVGPNARAPVLGAGLAGVLMLIWAGQLAGLLEQNHPHAARLVPGHLRVLRRVAVAVWFVGALVLGALAWWLAEGQLVFWGCVLMAALLATGFAWCVRWPVLWLVPSFAPALWTLLPPRFGMAALWLAGVDHWQAHALVLTPVLLGLQALGVAAVFGRGGPAHARAFARQSVWRDVARKGWSEQTSGGFALWGGWFARFDRPIERSAGAWLAHLLRRARPSRRSVMARAELVLHGSQHWLRLSLGVLTVLVLLGVVAGGLWAIWGPLPGGMPTVWRHGHIGIAVGVASIGLNALFMLPRALWTSRREQALLALLPGMPRGRALNRAVAIMQLRHAGFTWLATAAVAIGFGTLADTLLGLAPVLVALPILVVWLLRAPARMGQPAGWKDALPIAGYMLTGITLMALLGWRAPPDLSNLATLAALAAACIALASALGLWRWRRLMVAPSALPAGRLA